jgi:hypothetical protein
MRVPGLYFIGSLLHVERFCFVLAVKVCVSRVCVQF